MKSFRRLVVLVLLAGTAWGALWLWQSPYFALWQINEGLAARDPGRVERYVDLEAFVKATADVLGALASDAIGTAGTDAGSRVLDALVGAVARGVGEAASKQGANELRRAIQEGRVERALGPFTVDTGLSAYGGIQTFAHTAMVELHGTCQGHDAAVKAVFEERDGPTLGYPKKYVLVGVDGDSVKQLAKQCRGPG